MEVLIKYRNERKKEGASMAELNGLDGRINACMSNVGKEKTAFDIELLNYRAQIASASPVNKELLARLDTHIFHQLGSTPAKIIDVKIRTISMCGRGFEFLNLTVYSPDSVVGHFICLTPHMQNQFF